MSDCSTEAMKPKAKTCGMCAHGINRLVSCWELDPQGSHHAQNEPACSKFAYRKQEGSSCNKSRGYDEIEQHYKQLEQVAKDMLGDLDYLCCTIPGLEVNGVRRYRETLRYLGVSLDD